MHSERRKFLKTVGKGLLGLSVLPVLAACSREASPLVKIMSGSQLEPGSLTIPKGTTVTWQNQSTLPQSITCDPAKAQDQTHVKLPQNAQPWDSGELYPGQNWTYTFQTPGTYVYFSRWQDVESMRGTVTVTG